MSGRSTRAGQAAGPGHTTGPRRGSRSRRLSVALAAVVVVGCSSVVAGCSSNPPTVCNGGFCEGPAHTYTTWDDLVFVLTWVGVVPVPPGTADGPARIVKPIRPAPVRIPGGF